MQVLPEFSDHSRSLDIVSHNCHVRRQKVAALKPLPFSSTDCCVLDHGRERSAASPPGPTIDGVNRVMTFEGVPQKGRAHVIKPRNASHHVHLPVGKDDLDDDHLPTPYTKTKLSSFYRQSSLSMPVAFDPTLASTPQRTGRETGGGYATPPQCAAHSYLEDTSITLHLPTPPSHYLPTPPSHKHDLDMTVLARETPPTKTPPRSTDGVHCISETPQACR